MPRARSVDLRQAIVERHVAGASLATVAQELGCAPWTVRTIWRRYRDRGPAGRGPDYAACGRSGPRCPAALHATTRALRRAHPGWGAGLIRTHVADAYPDQAVPHEATLRRWFRDAGLTPPRRPPRPPDPPRATSPHARWQLDATEQIGLADGRRVSWVAASDEASGAMLGAVVFPLGRLGPGRPPGGAGGAAALVRAVGAAPPAAGRQWDTVGLVERAAA